MANSKLIEALGLVRPAQCPVTASDIPKALAFWEDSVGYAPHFPAIPARKTAAKGTCAAPIHLLRVKSTVLPAWGQWLVETVPEIPGKGRWSLVPPC